MFTASRLGEVGAGPHTLRLHPVTPRQRWVVGAWVLYRPQVARHSAVHSHSRSETQGHPGLQTSANDL